MLPSADRHLEYASRSAIGCVPTVCGPTRDRAESVGRRIRDGELHKVPYLLVVGDREQEADEIALREHKRGDAGSVPVQEFIRRLRSEVESRSTG